MDSANLLRHVLLMKVRFVVLEPESKRGTYEVPLPIVVGRGNEAKFRIQQDRISRKHCEIFDRDGDVYVRDLGSTNGTFLDGEQIAASLRTPVPPGSVLQVGTIEIRIDYDGSGRLPPAAAAAPDVPEDATIGFAPEENAEPVDAIPEESEDAEPMEAEPVEQAAVEAFVEPAALDDAAPAVDAASLQETQKAPEPGDFGEFEVVEEPAIEAFPADAFGGGAEGEPVAEGSFDFLAGSNDEPPADDEQLGDFFKGLK